MFNGVFKILLITFIIFAVVINVVAFVAEKIMNKRISKLADKDK